MSARIIAAVFFAAVAGSQLNAQGGQMDRFQTDITVGWAHSETDTSPEIEIDQFFIAGTFHLKPVDLADHPWNEAAFLEHSTFVTGNISYADFEVGSFSADGPVFGAGFRYAEKDVPIMAEVDFSIGTLEGDMGIDIDLTTIGGRVGYWVERNAIIGAGFGYSETEFASVFEVEEVSYGVFGKIVHDLQDGQAINGEAHVGILSVDDGSSTEENVEFGVAGDFYFTPQYSVGGLVDFSFGDATSEEGTTFGVRGSAWFTPQVAVGVQASTFVAEDDMGDDQDNLLVFLNARF